MHYPQLPDEAGWDVNATQPVVLADDWQCSETGWVKDFHFWGSWKDGIEGQILYFVLSIHSDIPANPPGIPYSRPGQTLWEAEVTNFTVTPFDPPSMEGWYDPSTGEILPNNHQAYFQYDVCLDESLWYMQEQGTIYWLNISAVIADPQTTRWGWKSTLDHFNDDAVWAYWGELNWQELREPYVPAPLMNPFNIMIDPMGQFVGGGGGGAFGQGWYFYPMEEWWNIWFYDHPFTYDNYKVVHIDLDAFPMDVGMPAFLEIAVNWSTDLWSLEQPPGDSAPPLPGVDEARYIGRQIVFTGIQFGGHYVFDYMIPQYNPEWVSVDVRGYNFIIEAGNIVHECIPRQQPSLDLSFVVTGEPPAPPRDTVVCEPQGGQNPTHPSTYWYDVTPTQFGRCDFHVKVYDSIASHYTNWIEPLTWQHSVHKVGSDWWVSWWDPDCDNAIFSKFRFQFDNHNPVVWSDWRTTISSSDDPYAQVIDSAGNHTAEANGYGYLVHVPFYEETQVDTCTYYKRDYPDYAPNGMPDFDQKQNGWMDPAMQWSHCGPVALANCLWWFDSKFEKAPVVPPGISDTYPLITAMGPWDDHDMQNVMPLVNNFAVFCNTNGPWPGTFIHDMVAGAGNWISAHGLADSFTIRLFPMIDPTFSDTIINEVLRSQDVILLLGFWEQEVTMQCHRVGGHYVTVAGVCADGEPQAICISDPWLDRNEGEPPAGSAHPSGIHNDAQFVSGPHGTKHHDKYYIGPVMQQCGVPYATELYGYPLTTAELINFEWQNNGDIPSMGWTGGPVFTVIEYALIICPAECPVIIGDADNSGGSVPIDIDDIVYIINYVFGGGPAPMPYAVASGDADCKACFVDIDDIVYLINYVFAGGPAPCTCEWWVSICGPLH
jgi:hypothetical protein